MKNKVLVSVALLVVLLYMFNVYYSVRIYSTEQVNASFVSARSMVVMEVNSGRVLLEKNKDKELAMASTTKIMTAILAIEESENLDEMVNIDPKAVGIEGTSIYLRDGERMPLRELLYGLMLASGNDASVAIASHIGKGDIEAFVDKMNKKALKIGAKHTKFANPHGLDAKQHFTTAYDLALITAHAHKNKDYREIAGTRKMQITSTPDGHNRFLVNKQRLLRTYDYTVSGKTGFTDNAGRCSVSVAKKDGLELVCVVLNAPNMFADSKVTFNKAYDMYDYVELLKPYNYVDSLPVDDGREGKVKLYSEKGFSYPLKMNEKIDVRIEKELPAVLSPPLKKQASVGEIKIYLGKDLIFSENIYTIESVESIELSNKVKDLIKKWFYD